ncbi:hypothetical protein H4582DRAFT_406656 [Lactarius indigo]|nr:hypothetical protein H4582DRAFT_406656 [Lactarius indigo]
MLAPSLPDAPTAPQASNLSLAMPHPAASLRLRQLARSGFRARYILQQKYPQSPCRPAHQGPTFPETPLSWRRTCNLYVDGPTIMPLIPLPQVSRATHHTVASPSPTLITPRTSAESKRPHTRCRKRLHRPINVVTDNCLCSDGLDTIRGQERRTSGGGGVQAFSQKSTCSGGGRGSTYSYSQKPALWITLDHSGRSDDTAGQWIRLHVSVGFIGL